MADVLDLIARNQLVAVLMGATVWVACRTPMLRRRPAVCHALWLLVLLKVVTPPITSMLVGSATVHDDPIRAAVSPSTSRSADSPCDCCAPIGDGLAPTASAAWSSPAGCSASEAVGFAGAEAPTVPSIAGPLPDTPRLRWEEPCLALLGVSLFVTGAFWIAATRRFLRTRRMLRSGAVETGREAALLREVLQRFNSPAAVKLRVVDAHVTPMLWAEPGCPVIVLPRGLVDSLSDDGLRNILTHELGHFVRRDHWVNVFAWFVATLFWWNPIAWLACRQLSAMAEVCCDALALERLTGSRRSYAQTLLMVVDSLAHVPPRRSEFGIAFGESHSLRRRFELIADPHVNARVTRRGWILLIGGFAALVLVPARAPESSAAVANAFQREAVAESTPLPSGDPLGELPGILCCPN